MAFQQRQYPGLRIADRLAMEAARNSFMVWLLTSHPQETSETPDLMQAALDRILSEADVSPTSIRYDHVLRYLHGLLR